MDQLNSNDSLFKGKKIATTNWMSSSYLRCSCDHVFDEVSVSWGIYDCDVEFAGLKLPQRNVNGDASLALSLQLV